MTNAPFYKKCSYGTETIFISEDKSVSVSLDGEHMFAVLNNGHNNTSLGCKNLDTNIMIMTHVCDETSYVITVTFFEAYAYIKLIVVDTQSQSLDEYNRVVRPVEELISNKEFMAKYGL